MNLIGKLKAPGTSSPEPYFFCQGIYPVSHINWSASAWHLQLNVSQLLTNPLFNGIIQANQLILKRR